MHIYLMRGNELPASATRWPDMFCNFYLVKYHKNTKNSTTTKGREKISADLESLELFDVCLTKFKNNQILLNKISHRFLQQQAI